YVFFCEGLKNFKEIDTLTQDTIHRKVRKLMGFYFGGKGYKNKENKSMPAYLRSNNYEEQDYSKMGLKRTDEWVDYEYYDWIKDYEKEKGEIVLTDCDFATPLFDKYECDRSEIKEFFAINTLRERKLEKAILESKAPKIVVIYGKQHWYFVWATLRDKGWKIVRGKI
ncbi:MAG: hypothetical protein KGV59_07425, partial [Tenacibaculum sp.]|nr:hypothetical protein [Tenacibaculum sp.]